MPMSNTVLSPPKGAAKPKLNLREVHAELQRLRERIEDLEDLRELNEAIARNRGKKFIPWEQAKKQLGLED